MSEAALIDAAVTAINAQLPAAVRAYPLPDVPDALPETYVEVSAYRRVYADGARSDGSLSRRGYVILTRAVARDAANVHTVLARIAEALDFATLPVGDQGVTVDFESGDPAAPDDGWYSALHSWTCSLLIADPK